MDAMIVGCGYLGSRIAALWRERGHRVFATTRTAAKAESLRVQGFEPIVCDVTRPETLTFPRADVFVTALAVDRSSGSTMRDIYIDGLRAIVDRVLDGRIPPPGRWVHVSSSSVYGQTDGNWVDESSPTDPEEPAGRTVLESEGIVRRFPGGAILLRFSGIYGPGRLLRRKSIEAGETIVGDAEKWLNLIHVDDGARAVAAAAERGEPGRIYNICDDEPVSRRDFYTAMADMLGAPPPQFTPPPPDAPPPPHERGNRRIRNTRMRDGLGVVLQYSNFRDGLRDIESRAFQ